MNQTELAWAAGLWDGEGTAGVRKNGSATSYRRIGASIRMTDRDVICRFDRAVGSFGKMSFDVPSIQHGRTYRPLHAVCFHSFESVQQLACLLWPRLSAPKRGQFKTALLRFLANPHEKRKPRGRVSMGVVAI